LGLGPFISSINFLLLFNSSITGEYTTTNATALLKPSNEIAEYIEEFKEIFAKEINLNKEV